MFDGLKKVGRLFTREWERSIPQRSALFVIVFMLLLAMLPLSQPHPVKAFTNDIPTAREDLERWILAQTIGGLYKDKDTGDLCKPLIYSELGYGAQWAGVTLIGANLGITIDALDLLELTQDGIDGYTTVWVSLEIPVGKYSLGLMSLLKGAFPGVSFDVGLRMIPVQGIDDDPLLEQSDWSFNNIHVMFCVDSGNDVNGNSNFDVLTKFNTSILEAEAVSYKTVLMRMEVDTNLILAAFEAACKVNEPSVWTQALLDVILGTEYGNSHIDDAFRDFINSPEQIVLPFTPSGRALPITPVDNDNPDLSSHQPGGVWVSPGTDSTVTNSVHFTARAYPSNPGDPAIDRVNFTAWWPTLGPESGPWYIVSQQYSPTHDNVYEYDWNLAGVPSGQLKIGFDVYNTAGNRNLSPNGTRTITYQPPSYPTNPPPSCTGGTWSIGQRVFLKKGAEIRVGSGNSYTVHTIVPEDGWAVDVIGGYRCVDGNDWWDISRANIDGGGTGWVNRVQAEYVPSAPSPDPSQPSDGIQVFDGANYTGPSRIFTVGKYSNLADYSWYDRIESIRFLGNYKNNYHVVLCSEKDFSGDPGHYDNDAGTLGNAQQNHVRSIEIYRKDPGSGIWLYDGENYSGESVFIPVGKTTDLSSVGFWDRAESIRFVGELAGGMGHAVLCSEKDLQGDPAHFDFDAPTLPNAQKNHVRSVEVYNHQIPVPPQNPNPAKGIVLDTINNSLDVTFDRIGEQFQIHVWGNNYDLWRNWDSSAGMHLDGLIQGQTYYWQAQARNNVGESPWGPQWSFTTAALPALISLLPNSGAQGEVLTKVQINGAHLIGATAVDFTGTGVTSTSVTVISDTQITVDITIASNAVLGERGVYVTTPKGSSLVLAGGFTVNAPPITLISFLLNQTYDSTPKAVTAITKPLGLDYTVTYNDSIYPPVDVGIYSVTATITSPGYSGITTGFLKITEHNAPTTHIISPLNSSQAVGRVVIQGTAFDPDGISQLQKVEIKIDDGNWVLAQGIGNWHYVWDTTTVTEGPHTIFARSYDGQYYSSEVSISVIRSSLYSAVFGNGQDGELVMAINTINSPIDSSCIGLANESVLMAINSAFSVGQAILIHQSQGPNAGQWERNIIQEYTNGTIILQFPLKYTYSSGAQVLVLKQYTNVTINSGVTWTAKAWNGTTGGILAFLANGTVTVSGTINATAKGFRGGSNISSLALAYQGEGTTGAGIQSSSANGNGGGAGAVGLIINGNYGMGGGGGSGGNATIGTTGQTGFGNGGSGGPGGAAGNSAGNSELTSMVFGGGGGAGSSGPSYAGQNRGGPGGNGGGIVFITGENMTVTGAITSAGANGGNGGNEAGGGGAGAAGSIYIKAFSAELGSNLVSALGAAMGGSGDRDLGAGGGNGSNGRIHLDCYDSFTGTTNPLLYADPIQNSATIILENLVQNYDGYPKSIEYTTVPSGLTASLTYSQNGVVIYGYPISAGNYDVSATITTPGYIGSSSGTLTITPAVPTGVTATDGTYSDKVRISWTIVSGATSYKVFRSTTSSSDTAVQIGSASVSPYDDTTAVVGTTYYYWVKAVNASGDSGFSSGDSGWRADVAGPYTSAHNPAESANGVPIDTNVVVHVLDDDSGVDQSTIVMTVEGAVVNPAITGSSSDYTLTYNPPADFGYIQVIDITIDASDLAGNDMIRDAYSFTTAAAPLMEGDVNLDGHVTITDAMLIARYKAGLSSLTNEQLQCADTTDDGIVSIADAMHISQWLVDPNGLLGVLKKPLWQSPADDSMLKPIPK